MRNLEKLFCVLAFVGLRGATLADDNSTNIPTIRTSNFILSDYVSERAYTEAILQFNKLKKASPINSLSLSQVANIMIPVTIPENLGLKGDFVLTTSPNGRKYIRAKDFQVLPWSKSGIYSEEPIKSKDSAFEDINISGYILATTGEITQRETIMVGVCNSLYTLYEMKYRPDNVRSDTEQLYAFWWDRAKGARNFSATINDILKQDDPEGYKLFNSVSLDHIFYISEDSMTLVGIASTENSTSHRPEQQEFPQYRFFKVLLSRPLSEIPGGRIFSSLLAIPSDLDVSEYTPEVNSNAVAPVNVDQDIKEEINKAFKS